MLTKHRLETILNNNPNVQDRLKTLKLAESVNPKFRTPHIVGGYLRNTYFGVEPKDCDVAFQGYQLNQPGIFEAIKEAEAKLHIQHYPNWEFENASATGITNDFYENTVGKFSHHTDYITMLEMDGNGTLYLGDKKTLSDLEKRVYDLRFSGVEIWMNHRSKDRSYNSCIVGDLMRGLYLGQCLNLKHSAIAEFLTRHFDVFYSDLSLDEQKAKQEYWMKKTKGDHSYQEILNRFGVTALKTNSPILHQR